MIEQLTQRYKDVLERAKKAAAGRPFTLVAVSKKQPIEAIEILYRLGHRDFGENYVQELTRKSAALNELGCTDIRWHHIGHLQTNKVKTLIPHVFAVHTVDSVKVAKELAKRWKEAGRTGALPIFIEVNVSDEAGKSGIHSDEVVRLVGTLAQDPTLRALILQGLMAIPDPNLPPQEMRQAFKRLRGLGELCRQWTQGQLSIGMSSDFELALAEQATHIRVGTAIFGER